MTCINHHQSVTLSLNRALWGEVSQCLMSVRFRSQGNLTKIQFFFAPTCSPEDRESMSEVVTEVLADFPEMMIEDEIIIGHNDFRDPDWQIVFLRKRSGCEPL